MNEKAVSAWAMRGAQDDQIVLVIDPTDRFARDVALLLAGPVPPHTNDPVLLVLPRTKVAPVLAHILKPEARKILETALTGRAFYQLTFGDGTSMVEAIHVPGISPGGAA